MDRPPPEGYLGAETVIGAGPAPELIEAGYAAEMADATLLHRGLNLADTAHVIALADAGVVPPEDAASLLATLLGWFGTPAEAFPYDPLYGDPYNARERELERHLGRRAGWLPTGRTRREAGRIAFRLAMRSHLLDLHATVGRLAEALADQAEREAATIWADTTYLQPAQPSTFGHYLGGFAEEATRNLARIEAVHGWASRSPAGAGGVGGTRIPIDRLELARLLGFSDGATHTRDAMWATDGLAEATATAAQAAVSLDRLAEDFEIFASPGFGYLTLHASVCRASVLMPQKRNPYALAVIRAGAGTLVGWATGLLVTQRTPSARTDNWLHSYGEVARSLLLARRVIALGAEVVRTLTVHREALEAAAGAHFTGAADLAEELVLRAGVDYRSSYRIVGRALAAAGATGQPAIQAEDLARAALEELESESGLPTELVLESLSAVSQPRAVVATRTAPGGSAPERVREHAAEIRRRLVAAAGWREDRQQQAAEAEERLMGEARRRAGKQ